MAGNPMTRDPVSSPTCLPALPLLLAALALLAVLVSAPPAQAQSGLTDRQILEAFYDATDGDNWRLNRNWKTSRPLNAWEGVTTNSAGSVTRLILRLNYLKGEIPAVLSGLDSLTHLYLDRNPLTGEIPAWLGSMSSLTHLYLYETQLSGEIPKELGSLANLQYLYIKDSRLSGEIPPELGDLGNLWYLDLGGNRLSGEIPPELGGLAELGFLHLNDNQLSGGIPEELGDLPKLRNLYLHRNQLSGEIPAKLGGIASLQQLVLFGNRLSGEIPPELGDLGNLLYLYLHRNQFSGEIPAELGDLGKLWHLVLHSNQLSGEIPFESDDFGALVFLHLHNNRLTGEIPPELGDLSSLHELTLNGNMLSGQIPTNLKASLSPASGLWRLTRLWLHDNRLTGAIPTELGGLSRLKELTLSCNAFEGAVPTEIGAISTLTQLWLHGNPRLLLGVADRPDNLARAGRTVVLSRPCPGDPPPTVPSGAPVGVSLNMRADGVTVVTWTPPSGGGPVTGYDVQYREASAPDWVDASHDVRGVVAYVQGMYPGTDWNLRVRARTSAGPGPWAVVTTMTLGTDAPDAPAEFAVADRHMGTLAATFDAPGTAVRGYELQYKEAYLSQVTYPSTDDPSTGIVSVFLEADDASPYVIDGLTNYVRYSARARAWSDGGYGPWTDWESAEPTDPTVSFRWRDKVQAWPLTGGGAGCDDNRARNCPGSLGFTYYGENYTVKELSLKDGVFRLRLDKDVPPGLRSGGYLHLHVRRDVELNPQPVVLTLPGDNSDFSADPTLMEWTGVDGSLRDSNGYPVVLTLYAYEQRDPQIRLTTDPASGNVVERSSVDVWVTLQPQDTETRVSVTLTGDARHGEDYTVTSPTADVLGETAVVTLTFPVSSTPERQYLSLNVHGDAESEAAESIRVQASMAYSQPAGDAYTADYASDRRDAITLTIAENVGAPAALTLGTTVNDEVEVSWSPPAGDGPAPTSYEVRFKETSAPDQVSSDPSSGWVTIVRTAASRTTLVGSTAGTVYDVRVRAQSAQGPGPWAALDFPGAVDRPTLEAIDGGIRVSWNAPAQRGGSAIDRYEVQYKDTTANTWSDGGHAAADGDAIWTARLTVRRSSSGTQAFGCYDHDAGLANCSGEGSRGVPLYLTSGVFTYQDTVYTIDGVYFVPVDRTLYVSFDSVPPPAFREAYTLYVDGVPYSIATADVFDELMGLSGVSLRWSHNQFVRLRLAAHTHGITGLSGGTYEARVRAVNDVGPGPWSPSSGGGSQASQSSPGSGGGAPASEGETGALPQPQDQGQPPRQGDAQQQQASPAESAPPTPGQTEPYDVQVTPGDGTLTVTWSVAPRDGFEHGQIRHALRWSQVAGVWANPTGEGAGGPEDGVAVEGGVTSYVITGLQNDVAAGVFVRSFTGGSYSERSEHSSAWVRVKGDHTTPRAGQPQPQEQTPQQPPPQQQQQQQATPKTFSVSGTASAAEGSDATLTVTLSEAAPAGGVTFTVTAGYTGSADSADVGGVASPVTVPGGSDTLAIAVPTADDAVDEDDETFTVTIAAVTQGWDPAGAGQDAATVTISDDDTAGVTITPTTLSVAEDGGASYTVVLDSRPTAAVTVTAVSSDPAKAVVVPAAVVIRPEDWNLPETFTVNGVADGDATDESVGISHRVASSDGRYVDVALASVAVAVADTTPAQEQQQAPAESAPPTPGQLEPYNIQITPGDGTLTVTWTVAPRAGFEDDQIRHALRWSQEPGVWANPADPNAGGAEDGLSVAGGVYSYTITGLQNGVATGVFVRSFTGGSYSERSEHSSEWVRTKGDHTTPRAE